MGAGLSVVAAGCGGSAAAGPEAGYVTVGIRSAPNNLDPRIGSDEGSARVSQLVYSRLMRIDEQLRVVPNLATRLDNPDPLTYVAHLRSGVRFHDGHELTSKDVVYTFGSFLDPEFVSPYKGAFRAMASVRAIDDYTVEFKLREPFGSFPVQLVFPIVPADAGTSLRAFPVGTGPYRFVRYAVDDHVVLSAFEGYWDGLPQNTGVVLKVIPDETMRGLELRKGTVDLIVNDVPPDIAYQLKRDELTLSESPGVDYNYIGFNMKDRVLSDRRVRHAIGYAVNRQAIVDYLRRGLATPAIGVLAPMAWAFEPSVHQFTHDVERAKSLLDEAGYRDPDGDGPEPRLHLTLKTSTDEFFRLQATILQQDLSKIGIDLDVRCLRIRDDVRRRSPGKFSTGHDAVGGRDRSRHAAPRLPLAAGAAVRFQSWLLQQSRSGPGDRPRKRVSGGGRTTEVLQPGAEDHRRGRALHQPLVQDARGRHTAGHHRPASRSPGGHVVVEGREKGQRQPGPVFIVSRRT